MSDSDTPPPSNPPPQSERLPRIPLARLRPGPNAPESLTPSPALVESVRTYGVLQPLLARQTTEGLEVLAGFKRMAAAREAGLEEVPVRLCRVDDSAIAAFYAASNLMGERRKLQAPTPPSAAKPAGEYKPSGRLNGLLEEELNRPAHQTPYKSILTLAVAVILILWAGLHLSRCRGPRPEPVPADPAEVNGSADAPTEPRPPQRRPDTPSTASGRKSVSDWRAALSEIDGIEVRDLNNTPRIVFQSPVFSRLTTIDPAQQRRLNRIAEAITAACADCLIVVIGHTDNDPVRPGGAFQSNDHLGELRAQEVVQYLTTRAGIPASRLRPISSGDRDPPFPNTPASNKAKNRTVSIEIQPARL
ncbi:MAG: OmpA family protein [Verrucomicrobia bacterium]|nr:OmpA family protein [Verrucomicrobiota bacterium]MCH8528246.1 OmpA family protein [Kiritimatiellia bacterium]